VGSCALPRDGLHWRRQVWQPANLVTRTPRMFRWGMRSDNLDHKAS
jgi:hypothetical protein